MSRHEVEFTGEGGLTLRGWLYVPDTDDGPFPAISMAHGYAGTRHHGLDRFALAFERAGFVVLLHDHRNFGESDVEEAGDVDPWRQIADWRLAISFLADRREVDEDRLGIWGSSYAGGHVLVLAATDHRIRAVVSQVPTTSGYRQGLRRVPPEAVRAMEIAFAEDDRARARGEQGERILVVSADAGSPAAYHSNDAVNFYLQPVPAGSWHNEVTLRSSRAARMYEPGIWAPRISPTPILFVVAMADRITLTDLALETYEQALQPKALAMIPGDHFAPYLAEFETASAAAVDWFVQYLI